MLEVYLVGAMVFAALTIWRSVANPMLAAHPFVAKLLGTVSIALMWPIALAAWITLIRDEYKRRG